MCQFWVIGYVRDNSLYVPTWTWTVSITLRTNIYRGPPIFWIFTHVETLHVGKFDASISLSTFPGFRSVGMDLKFVCKNPTWEAMCRVIFEGLGDRLDSSFWVRIIHLVIVCWVWETSFCAIVLFLPSLGLCPSMELNSLISAYRRLLEAQSSKSQRL